MNLRSSLFAAAVVISTCVTLMSCASTEAFDRARAVAESTLNETAHLITDTVNRISDAIETQTEESSDSSPQDTKGGITAVNTLAGNRPTPAHDYASVVQTASYRQLAFDTRVRSLPNTISAGVFREPAQYLPELSEYLGTLSDDPFIRVKLIHDWIADNIAYDTAAFFSNSVTHKSVYDTVRTRKAVCQGYAELFEFMAQSAGFDAEVVSGYARGFGFSPLEDEDLSDSNHAWNAVYIDNSWYLLDCTWDAGGAVGRTFRKDYSTEYLFLEPENMIYTHFPADSTWQLIEEPRAAAVIEGLPGYRGNWFLYGLPVLPNIGKHNTVNGLGVLNIDTPDSVILSTQLVTQERSVENAVFSQHDGIKTEILISAPESGDYILQIFAKKDGETASELVLQIGVHSEGSTSLSLPVAYSPFFDDRCYIHAPLGKPIVRNANASFDVYLPGYVRAYLSDGKDRYPLEATGTDYRFRATLSVPECRQLTLFASKTDSGRLSGIVAFDVE